MCHGQFDVTSSGDFMLEVMLEIFSIAMVKEKLQRRSCTVYNDVRSVVRGKGWGVMV